MTDKPSRLVCAVFPPPYDNNPYQPLLHAALGRRGVTIVAPGRVRSMWRLRAGSVDAVHLHWVEYMIFSRRRKRWLPAWFFPAVNALHVLAAVAAARLRGIRIVWTLHNLRPHDPRHPRIEAAAFWALTRLVHAIVVHSRFAAERVGRAYGVRDKVGVLAMGSFGAAYEPTGRTRAEARAHVRLPADSFVYLVFGAVRRYKNIPEIIHAFRGLEGSEQRLLVVGQANSDELRAEIEAAAAEDPRVILMFGFVPDDLVNDYFVAADVLVLGYAEVFSSAALMLALSKGLPAVAPARGTASETAAEATVTFEPGKLAAALDRVRSCDLEGMRAAARRIDARHSWDAMAETTVALYRGASLNGEPSTNGSGRGRDAQPEP